MQKKEETLRRAVLVTITDGKSHAEMMEDRCENLMDQRARWNYSFQLEGWEKPYCIAIEIVNRVTPENKIFTPAKIGLLQRTVRRRGRQKWWSSLMGEISQLKNEETLTDDCTIWRFGGGAHCWPYADKDVVIFGEYDAIARQGYALIVAYSFDKWWLEGELFQHPIGVFDIANEDESKITQKW